MRTQDIEYRADGVRMVGQYVVDDGSAARRPGILIIHEGPGLTEHTKKIAARLAGHGLRRLRHGLPRRGQAAPQSGRGAPADRRLDRQPDAASWPVPRRRSTCSRHRRKSIPVGLAAIGYCFGGTTALELGREGCDLKAIVGFHSGLATSRPQAAKNIKGKVLVNIGAEDPIIPPEQRAAFESEMKAAGLDWRLQLYGGAGHSFTNPAADSRGMQGFYYHEATDRRSWSAMIELFNETLK